MLPEQLFADLVAREPGRPFVTYYDGRSGERSELSAKSLANWVAKTHYLLTDELGVGVGDTAFVALPAHWISVPVVLGCLTAGLELTASAQVADVAFVSPDTLASAVAAGVADVYAVAPSSAAVGFGADVPPGAQDYVIAVRPQPDNWGGVRFRAEPEDPCIDGRSRSEVSALAGARAAELGFAASARVLSTRDWDSSSAWIDTLLAPLSVGGSVIYVHAGSDPAALDRWASQERVTNRL